MEDARESFNVVRPYLLGDMAIHNMRLRFSRSFIKELYNEDMMKANKSGVKSAGGSAFSRGALKRMMEHAEKTLKAKNM